MNQTARNGEAKPSGGCDQTPKPTSLEAESQDRRLAHTAGSDRNLLVGILALQLDFINRDQLVSAMQAWLLHKSQPLEQVLLDQGVLDAETSFLLLALVQKHLEQHQCRAERSLAALSPIRLVLDDLRAIGDRQIEDSLALISGDVQHDDGVAPLSRPEEFGETAAFLDRDAPTNVQKFRILRTHAEGGLGRVSIALDEKLNREVAIKEIKDVVANDPATRSRFLIEAEITGQLQHPGVVPVYGLGRFSDGRPFYAMRFVAGESLKEAISALYSQTNKVNYERGLRRLITRFVAVCNVIEYAHARGVLHRDIKPSNIMLGAYGETLVVDWGLAGTFKTTTNGSDAVVRCVGCRDASIIGTPQFMSPEQAAGRCDQVGPRSDVYGLGATLYCVLTGRPPLTGHALNEIVQQARCPTVTCPHEINPRVPPALEAICLRAMSPLPERRYESPLKMAEDIESWLADELVSSYSETLNDRLRRWIREHAGYVGSAAPVIILMLTTTTVVSMSLYRDGRMAQSRIAALEESGRIGHDRAKEQARRASLAQAESRRARQETQSTRSQLTSLESTLAERDERITELQEVAKSAREQSSRFKKLAMQSEAEILVLETKNAQLETKNEELGNDRAKAMEEAHQAKMLASSYGQQAQEARQQLAGLEAFASAARSAASQYIDTQSRIIDAEPENARAFHRRALAYLRIGDLERAIIDLDKSIKLDPSGANTFLDRGRVRCELQQWQEALADFDQAALLAPTDSSALFERAWLRATCPLDRLRDGDRAVADATKAQQLASRQDWWALQCLAAGYAESGNFERAVDYQSTALEMKSEMSEEQRAKALACLASFEAGRPYRDMREGR